MPFEEIMRKHKQGTLRSGSGAKVTSKKQATAIAMKYPHEKKSGRGKGFKSLG